MKGPLLLSPLAWDAMFIDIPVSEMRFREKVRPISFTSLWKDDSGFQSGRTATVSDPTFERPTDGQG